MAETEAFLLRRFTNTGDAEALGEIIRRHAGLVYGAALRVLADVDRASDVAQETFLQLTKDAHRVTGSLPGWLHRVATHKAIDRMRRDTSRRHRETTYAAGQRREVTDWKEISLCVDQELDRLDSQIRDILVAYFLQGRTTRQIAVTRGISQATVSRRIETGVTQLRALLRRRGVLVAAGALAVLLRRNAVQAAPPQLAAELGKVALVGGHATASTAPAVGASGAQTAAEGFLAGLKAKATVAAACAVLGAGTVVTYQQATQPDEPGILMARSVAPTTPRPATKSALPASGRPVTAGSSPPARNGDRLFAAGVSRPREPVSEPQPAIVEQSRQAAVPPTAGEAVGKLAPARAAPADEGGMDSPAKAAGYVAAGPFYSEREETPAIDPNDSNDRKNKDAK